MAVNAGRCPCPTHSLAAGGEGRPGDSDTDYEPADEDMYEGASSEEEEADSEEDSTPVRRLMQMIGVSSSRQVGWRVASRGVRWQGGGGGGTGRAGLIMVSAERRACKLLLLGLQFLGPQRSVTTPCVHLPPPPKHPFQIDFTSS